MKKLLFVALALVASITVASADELLESYQAVLSARDHFSSSGQRLQSAAAVIRQDRANYHKFGLRDPGDEGDSFFADVRNRELLEKYLERGRSKPGVLSAIVNGTPTVVVKVFRMDNGAEYVTISLL